MAETISSLKEAVSYAQAYYDTALGILKNAKTDDPNYNTLVTLVSTRLAELKAAQDALSKAIAASSNATPKPTGTTTTTNTKSTYLSTSTGPKNPEHIVSDPVTLAKIKKQEQELNTQFKDLQQNYESKVLELKVANSDIKKLNQYISTNKKQLKLYTDLPELTTEQATEVKRLQAALAEDRSLVEAAKARQTAADAAVKDYEKQMVTLGKKFPTKTVVNGKFVYTTNNSSNKAVTSSNATSKVNLIPTVLNYKYNAPMTYSAYLGNSIQSQVMKTPGLITNDYFDSTLSPWKNGKPAKGVIRMSKHFADLADKPVNSALAGANYTVDDNPYGFRFLYNPTSVSMAWGIVESFSPQFVASGSDRGNAVSVGLMKSAITFSLMLNRIGDMQFVSQTGFLPPTRKSYMTDLNYLEALEAAKASSFLSGASEEYSQLTRSINALQGKASDIPQVPRLPYPGFVSDEDAAMIYKKGTMYDIEYLFKSINGYSSGYNSSLNGMTSDRGWLNPIPVELHLGDGLRYLVRISSLDLEHVVFNERMVPILSTVNVTCTRYFDGPEMFASTDTKSDVNNRAFGAVTQPANTATK